MATVEQTLSLISSKVRCVDLLRSLDYHADKIVPNGDRVKCFCPIHKEQVFANLFVDLKRATFKCSMRKCVGFVGGTIIELYAIVKGVSALEAALEIVRIQGLEVDVSPLLEAQGAESPSLPEPEAAVRNDSALPTPRSAEQPKVAQARPIKRTIGKDSPIEECVEYARAALARHRTKEAAQVLEDVLARDPLHFPAVRLLAGIHVQSARKSVASDLLRKTAVLLEEAGQMAQAIEALEQLAEWQPDDVGAGMELARRLDATNQSERAAAIRTDLVRVAEKGGLWAEALELTQSILEFDPSRLGVAVQQSRLLGRLGRVDEARQGFLRVHGEFETKGDSAGALEALMAVADLCPDDYEILQRLAETHAGQGRVEAAIECLLQGSEKAHRVGDFDAAVSCLERAKKCGARGTAVRRRLGDLYLELGRDSDGVAELKSLAEEDMAAGRSREGLAIYERLTKIVPDDIDVLVADARALAAAGKSEQALARYRGLAASISAKEGHDAATVLLICEEALGVDAEDGALLRIQAGELLRADRREAAGECLVRLWAVLERGEAIPEILTLLSELLGIDPDNAKARGRLAELLAAQCSYDEAAEHFHFLCERASSPQEKLRILGAWVHADPANTEAQGMIAQVFEEQGARDKACEAYELLAKRHMGLGEMAEARRALEKCMALDPDCLAVARQLASHAVEFESAEEARPWILRTLELAEAQCAPAEVLAEYESRIDLLGEDTDLQLRFARWLTGQNWREKALVEWRKLAGLASCPPSERLEALEHVVRIEPESPSALCGLAEALQACARGDESADAYCKAASIFLKEGRSDEARDAYFAVLRLRPEDDAAREALAELLETKGDLAEASKHLEALADEAEAKGDLKRSQQCLERVFALDDSRLDVSERLVEICGRTGDQACALAQLRRLHADAFTRRKWKLAQKHIDSMVAIAGETPEIHALQVEDLLAQKKVAEATAIMKRLLETHLAAGESGAAEKTLARLEELAPKDIAVKEQRVRFCSLTGDFEQAAAVSFEIEETLWQEGKTEEALVRLVEIKGQRPSDWPLRRRLIARLLEVGKKADALTESFDLIRDAHIDDNLEAAARATDEVRRAYATDSAVLRDLAHVELECGRREDAIEDLGRALGVAQEAGRFDEMLALSDDSLKIAPDSWSLCMARIEALEGLGRVIEAAELCVECAGRLVGEERWSESRALYERSIQLNDDLGAREGLLQCLEAQGEFYEARRAMTALADAYDAAGRKSEAIGLLERLLKNGGDALRVLPRLGALQSELGQSREACSTLVQLCDVLAAQGRETEVIENLTRARGLAPEDVDVLRRLVQARIRTGEIESAQRDLRDLVALLPSSKDGAPVMGEYEAFLSKAPAAHGVRVEYATWLEGAGRRDEAKGQWVALAAAYRTSGSSAKMIEALQHGLEIDPDDIDLRLELADACQQAGDGARAIREYAEAMEELEGCGELDRAVEVGSTLCAVDPGNPEWLRRKADLLEQSGEKSAAVEDLLRLIEQMDAAGKEREAIVILRRCIGLADGRLDLMQRLAERLEAAGEDESAAEEWRSIGLHNRASGLPAEALVAARNVVRLVPSDLASLTDLVDCLVESECSGEAIEVLFRIAKLAVEQREDEKAASALATIIGLEPKNDEALAQLADLHETRGDRAGACRLYRQLADLRSSAGDVDGAIGALQKVRGFDSDDQSVLCSLMDLYRANGRLVELAREGLALIDLLFARDRDQDALTASRRLRTDLPESAPTITGIAEILARHRGGELGEQWICESAQMLLDGRRVESAVHLCEEALPSQPDSTKIRAIFAECLIQSGQNGRALDELAALRDLYEAKGARHGVQVCLEKAIDLSPDNVELLWPLAMTYERERDFEKAVATLERLETIARSSKNTSLTVECLERLARLESEEPAYLERLAEACFEAQMPEKAVVACRERSKVCERAQDLAAASKSLERILAYWPHDVQTLQDLVALAERSEDWPAHLRWSRRLLDHVLNSDSPGEAIAISRSICERHPGQTDILQILFDLYLEQNDSENAAEYGRRLADLLIGNDEFAEALGVLEKIQAVCEADPQTMTVMADLAEKTAQPQTALSLLNQAFEIHRDRGDAEEALALATRILAKEPRNARVRAALGELLEVVGRVDEAVEAYSEAAVASGADGDNDRVIALLSHLLNLAPDRVEERVLLAQAYEDAERTDEAIAEYLVLMDGSAADGDTAGTIEFGRQLLSLNPDHVVGHTRLAAAFEANQDIDEALEQLEWLALDSFEKGDYAEAEGFITRGLALVDDDYEFRRLYARVLEVSGRSEDAVEQDMFAAGIAVACDDPDRAIAVLEHARDLMPQHTDLRRQLIRLYQGADRVDEARDESLCMGALLLGEGMVEDARAVLDSVIACDADCKQTHETVAEIYRDNSIADLAGAEYLCLARLYAAEEDHEMTIECGQTALSLDGTCLEARELLAHAYLETGDGAAAHVEFQELLAAYLESGAIDRAEPVCRQMAAIAPDSVEPLAELARIYRVEGREEDEVSVLADLVDVYQRTGDIDQAVQTCRLLVERRRDDTSVRLKYIELYAEIGPEVDLVDDYHFLAVAQVASGAVLEASRYYEKTLQLAPNRDDIREEFITFLFENGQTTRALSEIDHIVEIFQTCREYKSATRFLLLRLKYFPEDSACILVLADTYLQARMRGKALETYRRLIDLHLAAGQPESAAQVFEKLVEIDPQNAELRTEVVGYLLDHGFREKGVSQARELASLYETRGMLDLAEQTLRSTLDRDPANSNLLRLVIDLHLRIGDEKELTEEYARLADLLMDEGAVKESAETLQRLIDICPDDVELRQKHIDTALQYQPETDLVDALVQLANLHAKSGNMEAATQLFNRVKQIEPSRQAGRAEGSATKEPVERGKKKAAKGEGNGKADGNGKTDKSIANYESLLQLNPANALAHLELARLLRQEGRESAAREHFDAAGEMLLAKGDLIRATEACEASLAILPENPVVRQRLARAVSQRGLLEAMEKGDSRGSEPRKESARSNGRRNPRKG